MRIEFGDGNALGIKGNSHFVGKALRLLAPILHAYQAVGELNSEPLDQKRVEVELDMATEAEKTKTPFKGKYVEYIPDDAMIDVLPARVEPEPTGK
jgi:hypothetical protein